MSGADRLSAALELIALIVVVVLAGWYWIRARRGAEPQAPPSTTQDGPPPLRLVRGEGRRTVSLDPERHVCHAYDCTRTGPHPCHEADCWRRKAARRL